MSTPNLRQFRTFYSLTLRRTSARNGKRRIVERIDKALDVLQAEDLPLMGGGASKTE